MTAKVNSVPLSLRSVGGPIALAGVCVLLGISFAANSSVLIWVAGVLSCLVVVIMMPFVGICLAPILDLWFSSVQTLGLPPRNYLVMLMAFLSLPYLFSHSSNRRVFPPEAAKLVRILGLFYSWALVSTAVTCILSYQSLDEALVTTLLSRVLICPVLAMLTFLFLRTRKQVGVFLIILVLGALTSSFLAVLQFLGVEFAWTLRFALGPLVKDANEVLASRGVYLDRVPGLASYSVSLGYHITNTAPIVIGALLGLITLSIPKWKNQQKHKYILSLIALIMLTGAVLADTRATILGIILSTIVVVLVSIRKSGGLRAMRVLLVSLVLIIAVGYFSARGVQEYGRWGDLVGSESSREKDLSRLTLSIAGFLTGFEYPLGTGISLAKYNQIMPELYESLRDFPGAGQIFLNAPHNHFANQAVAFGLPGLLLAIAYFVYLIQLTLKLNDPQGDPFYRLVGWGLLGSFSAELVYIQTHNGGPFNGDIIHWYLVGVLLACTRLRRQEIERIVVSKPSSLYQSQTVRPVGARIT